MMVEYKATVDSFVDAISKMNSPELEREFKAQFDQAKSSFMKAYDLNDDTDTRLHLDDMKAILANTLKHI